MSGIAGLFYLDGRPVEQTEIEQMTNILAHRGPDNAGIWRKGSVGLGHRMLHTTPESLHEKLPLTNISGDLVITADARIDNRDELIPLLGFDDRPAEDVADSQLILAAYEKWGEACPEKLIGDFAFVIWDGRQQQLFCARDHLGIRPLYYFNSNQVFAFGSEIKSLLCLAAVPRRLNELRIGYHLSAIVEDKSITFYHDIFRLLPGHSMIVNPSGIYVHCYWSLNSTQEITLESDEAYAEAFREIFTEAVRCRVRSDFSVGSALSGGLDSSAVTCVAQDLLAQDEHYPLYTVSAVYDQTTECDERYYIDVVRKQGKNLQSEFVNIDQFGPLADLEKVFWHMEEPFSAPTLYIPWRMYQTAQKQGVRILLDGLDGDSTVYQGDGYLAELARTGQWDAFVTEAKAIAQHENFLPVPFLLKYYGLPYLTELAQAGKWTTFATEANDIAKSTGISRWRLLRNYGLRPVVPQSIRQTWRRLNGRNGTSPKSVNEIVDQNFAKRINLEDHLEMIDKRRSGPVKTAREEHFALLAAGLGPYVFELADRASAAFSIKCRHPFADRRLVEFCLALPAKQKLHQGWGRMILRRALTGILPEEIQWRGGKTTNRAAVTAGLLAFEKKLFDEIIVKNPESIETYVDIETLRTTYFRYLSQRDSRDEMRVWQAVILGLWMHHVAVET